MKKQQEQKAKNTDDVKSNVSTSGNDFNLEFFKSVRRTKNVPVDNGSKLKPTPHFLDNSSFHIK